MIVEIIVHTDLIARVSLHSHNPVSNLELLLPVVVTTRSFLAGIVTFSNSNESSRSSSQLEP